jgi:deoxyuridine 5'-triphosphate nucleotidohydrolase
MTTYFETIETAHKAYLFGLALNEHDFISHNDIAFYSISKKELNIITQYRNSIKYDRDNISIGKLLVLPNIDPNLIKYFIYGFIETNNSIVKNLNNISLNIKIGPVSENSKPYNTIPRYFYKIIEDFGIPFNTKNIDTNLNIVFVNTNIIDFLGSVFTIYRDIWSIQTINSDIYTQYAKLISNCNILSRTLIHKTLSDAVLPTKAKQSDVGYDLTIIKHHKNLGLNTNMYDTGITIKPEFGYYAEVVPRSSLSKSGYMLTNSIGIIDASYTGNIYVVLTKIDETKPDLELPFKCCQLIFRKQIYTEIINTDMPLDETARGDGGFGSSNNI